jgi:hypothetical protein
MAVRIPRVSRGDKITADHLNRLADAIRENTVLSAPGGVNRTPQGVHIRGARRGVGSAAEGDVAPFHVFTRTKPDNPNIIQGKVYSQSSLVKSIKSDDRITITGLDDGTDAAWFDLIVEDLIWLEGIYIDGVLDSVEINNSGSGDSWTDWPNPVTFALNKQSRFRELIAYCHEDPDTNLPIVHQRIRTDLILHYSCEYGDSAQVPFPYHSPYIATI